MPSHNASASERLTPQQALELEARRAFERMDLGAPPRSQATGEELTPEQERRRHVAGLLSEADTEYDALLEAVREQTGEQARPAISDPKLRFLVSGIRTFGQMVDFVGAILPGTEASTGSPGPGATGLIDRGFQALGVPAGEGPSDVVSKLGEEAAGAAMPALGKLATGGKIVAPSLQRMATEAGAIYGGARGRQAAEGEPVSQEMKKGLIGSVVGGGGAGIATRLTSKAGGALGSMGEVVTNVLRNRASRARIERMTNDEIRAAAADIDDALSRWEGLQRLADQKFPGVELTLDAAAADPNLKGLAITVFSYRGAEGPTYKDTALMRAHSDEALVRAFIARRPGGSERDARVSIQAYIDNRMGRVLDRVAEMRGVSMEDANRIVREEFEILSKDFTEWASEEFPAIAAEADRIGVRLNARPIVKAYDAVVKEIGGYGSLTPELKEFAERIKRMRKQKVLSYREMRQFEIDLNDTLFGSPSGISRKAHHQLTGIKDGVEKATRQMGEPYAHSGLTVEQSRARRRLKDRNITTANQELADRYVQAKAKFQEGKTRLREGSGFELQRERRGRLSTPELLTLDYYFASGERGGVLGDELLDTFKRDPKVVSAYEDYIVERAIRGLFDEGGFMRPTADNASKLRSFIVGHREMLQRFPGALDRIRSIEKITQSAQDMGMLGRPTNRTAVERGALRLFVDDPAAAVASILDLPTVESQVKAANVLLRAARKGGEGALAGLRREVWKHLESRVFDVETLPGHTVQGVSPKELLRVLSNNEEVLATFLGGKQHVDELREFLSMATAVREIPVRDVARTVNEPLTMLESASRNSFLSTFYRPVIRTVKVASWISRAQKALGAYGANQLIREIIINPELFRALNVPVTDANVEKLVGLVYENMKTIVPRVAGEHASDENESNPKNSGVTGR